MSAFDTHSPIFQLLVLRKSIPHFRTFKLNRTPKFTTILPRSNNPLILTMRYQNALTFASLLPKITNLHLSSDLWAQLLPSFYVGDDLKQDLSLPAFQSLAARVSRLIFSMPERSDSHHPWHAIPLLTMRRHLSIVCTPGRGMQLEEGAVFGSPPTLRHLESFSLSAGDVVILISWSNPHLIDVPTFTSFYLCTANFEPTMWNFIGYRSPQIESRTLDIYSWEDAIKRNVNVRLRALRRVTLTMPPNGIVDVLRTLLVAKSPLTDIHVSLATLPILIRLV